MSAGPKAVAAAVDRRDGEACVRCGLSLAWLPGSRHHRQRRQVGGHRVANLILLCGSGTTGCHGWVHANPQAARDNGWIVSAYVKNVELVPVKRWTPEFGLQWFCIDDAGAAWLMSPDAARKRFAFLGLEAAL